MTRKQRGVKEPKKAEKVDNPDRSKHRSSKKRKRKTKQERLWDY